MVSLSTPADLALAYTLLSTTQYLSLWARGPLELFFVFINSAIWCHPAIDKYETIVFTYIYSTGSTIVQYSILLSISEMNQYFAFKYKQEQGILYKNILFI